MRQGASSRSVPHALEKAHERLQDSLKSAICDFSEGRELDGGTLGRFVERFVNEFRRVPGGREEIERRASFVETQCVQGSRYRASMAAAWQAYRTSRKRRFGPGVTGERLNLHRLWKEAGGRATLAAELGAIRDKLEGLLRARAIGDSVAVAFQKWCEECQAIQRDADRWQADGCRCLRDVHRAFQPSELTSPARDRIERMFLGAWLDPMRDAAESLMAWAEESSAPDDTTTARKHRTEKATGKKRSTVPDEAREKIIAALTKHHEYADGSCLELKPVGNNELARLADVSRSTTSGFFEKEFGGHTKYQTFYCGDAVRLVAAIKQLRGEFSPDRLFGRNPPGEGTRDDEE